MSQYVPCDPHHEISLLGRRSETLFARHPSNAGLQTTAATIMKEFVIFVAFALAAQLAVTGVLLWLFLPLPTDLARPRRSARALAQA